MPSENHPVEQSTSDLRALLAALALLVLLVGFVYSCGTDDLVFPGNIPATSTSAPTNVPTSTATP